MILATFAYFVLWNPFKMLQIDKFMNDCIDRVGLNYAVNVSPRLQIVSMHVGRNHQDLVFGSTKGISTTNLPSSSLLVVVS